MNRDSEDFVFEKWLVSWVRTAFKAKGNKGAIHGLLNWSEEIAMKGRETQKQFLGFCIDFFRQALLLNYQAKDLVYFEPSVSDFKLERFAPFVHQNNIVGIFKELERAIFHIERNGNAKVVLTDLSLQLTKLIHVKAS